MKTAFVTIGRANRKVLPEEVTFDLIMSQNGYDSLRLGKCVILLGFYGEVLSDPQISYINPKFDASRGYVSVVSTRDLGNSQVEGIIELSLEIGEGTIIEAMPEKFMTIKYKRKRNANPVSEGIKRDGSYIREAGPFVNLNI